MGWVFLATTVVILGIGLIATGTLRGRARGLESFIKGMTLPLTDVALRMIPRRLFRVNLGLFIGLAPMWVMLVALGFVAPHSHDLSRISIIAMLGLASGTLGSAIACTTNIGPSRPDLPRVARATRPRMTDYLSPVWAVTGIVVCTTGLLVAVLVLPTNTASSWMNQLLVALIVVNALTLVAAPLLAHRLLASPQPANDSLQLAWDDALRAHGLRNVWLAPLAMGVATAIFAINTLYPVSEGVGGLEYVVCLVGLRLWENVTRPGSRFQRRLWPITPQPVVGSYAV